ncbi:unnamed protein product [Acanthocheilonema viteae]|uniref:Uncharacterized protein n=1 Tax=Acanthocheilonema viteae TaxID=6277 RepID=A0A498SJ34_ACAVI|nr:unnamed protein product [Acanthocheilonema viteae]
MAQKKNRIEEANKKEKNKPVDEVLFESTQNSTTHTAHCKINFLIFLQLDSAPSGGSTGCFTGGVAIAGSSSSAGCFTGRVAVRQFQL